MSKYLIKLKPYDKFFFGTGKEFGEDNQNYFIVSSYFPQQTTLLGMLRYQMLRQAGDEVFSDDKIQSPQKATELIGKHSFNADEMNDFGKIESISPVFLIQNGEEKIYPCSREYQKNSSSNSIAYIAGEFEMNGDQVVVKKYNPKMGLDDLFLNGDDYLSYDDVFIPTTQVGIRKKYEGGTDESAFYMQTFYRFAASEQCNDPMFEFAFYATLQDDTQITSESLVYMGGERQPFQMTVENVTEGYSCNREYLPTNGFHKIILLSDAYHEGNLSKQCDFAITGLRNFSCLKTRVGIKKYHNVGKNKRSEIKKSDQVQLYTRGSVFYFADDEKLKQFAETLKKSPFYQIGYNYFKTINKA